jgi:hypothetical protein
MFIHSKTICHFPTEIIWEIVIATALIRYYGHVLNTLQQPEKEKIQFQRGLRKKIDDL